MLASIRIAAMRWQRNPGSPFEGYAIFMGRVQMFQCLEILLVFFLDAGEGEEIDGYCCMANGSGSSDAGAGDVVGVSS